MWMMKTTGGRETNNRETERSGRSVVRTRDERGASAKARTEPRGRRSGGLTRTKKRGGEGYKKERERTRERKGERTEGTGIPRGGTGGVEVSRDDAVVRLQGRRKEEPRREPVPVTGPPAGRRTRHTAPYRPLLSHSLPSPRSALRPSRHRCITSLRTSRRLLATAATLRARSRVELPSSSSNNVNSRTPRTSFPRSR